MFFDHIVVLKTEGSTSLKIFAFIYYICNFSVKKLFFFTILRYLGKNKSFWLYDLLTNYRNDYGESDGNVFLKVDKGLNKNFLF